ncbi:MAG: sigma-54-dependent Fis family transcriptional regulator [Acidobacteria bacterium]|nr:sigma-54-dependent Fis family transcriptional regulator [Acidobacteriota bacterium]
MLQEAVRTEVAIPPPPPPAPRLQPRKPLTLVTAQRAVALDEFETFVGVSPNVAALKEFIAVQSSDREISHAILLIGERGLRQEQIARVLHQASAHWSQPFMSVNAHGLNDEALHALLFGKPGQKGMLETCGRGTIFINELTQLPPLIQQRFASHIEELRWRAYQATAARAPRLVFATAYDPTGMRAENRIAYGLVELLKSQSFTIKPLRERSEDIPFIAKHLTERIARRLHKGPHELTPAALRVLSEYDWEGNLDELEAVLEAAVAGTQPAQLTEDLLPARLRYATLKSIPDNGVNLPHLMDEYEHNLLSTALRQTGGNQTKASALLGLRVQTLNMKLKRFKELGMEVKW